MGAAQSTSALKLIEWTLRTRFPSQTVYMPKISHWTHGICCSNMRMIALLHRGFTRTERPAACIRAAYSWRICRASTRVLDKLQLQAPISARARHTPSVSPGRLRGYDGHCWWRRTRRPPQLVGDLLRHHLELESLFERFASGGLSLALAPRHMAKIPRIAAGCSS